MTLKDKNAALLLVDFQTGFDDEAYWGGNRNNKNAEQNALQLLEKWRALGLPILHAIHSSQDTNSLLHQSHPGFEMKTELKPQGDEPLYIKNVNSAFIGTSLKEDLEQKGINTLVIVGLTTNHCISTTTRMAGNFGFNTILVSDATATFDRKGINGEVFSAEIIHQTTLANLQEEFAEIASTEAVLSNV